MGVHEFPILNPLSHFPPHIISLDHPCAAAPSILYPVSNIDWWFVSYMIVYMFQCHSPKSSHPLPHSPKVHSIHLCLFCCLAYRVIITIFLNSIYITEWSKPERKTLSFFQILYRSDIIWCLSLSDLLHLVWWCLGPSMLLQMALFHPFLWNSVLIVNLFH